MSIETTISSNNNHSNSNNNSINFQEKKFDSPTDTTTSTSSTTTTTTTNMIDKIEQPVSLESDMALKFNSMNTAIDIMNPAKYRSPIMDSTGSPINFSSSSQSIANTSSSSLSSVISSTSSFSLSDSLNSSLSMSESDKKTRRFSLYVYQQPTDEQRQQISELYGYKGHNDDMGYAYAHDSNILAEDNGSSSDSYSSYRPTTRSRSTSRGHSPLFANKDKSLSPTTTTTTTTNNNNQQQSSPLSHETTLDPPTKQQSNKDEQQSLIKGDIDINNTKTKTMENGSNAVNIKIPKTQQQELQNITAAYSSPQQQQQSAPLLAYPHTIVPYTLPPASNVISELKTLEPPDPNQLPQSYLSTVKSAYASQDRPVGGYSSEEYNEKESILRPIAKPLSTAKDWNAEFQTLVNNNRMEGYREISKLAHDFVYTAKIYGKVIISELTLPLHLKTIKPINIGGVAGGHKYIALGILFKLALDSQGLYVGDQNAMKAAGHELKGLMSYYNARVEGLHHPLMALIDYRGYRLVAMSLLPITGETIVYGSSDGGITVHSDNELFNQKMKKSASILNIKGHVVGRDTPKLLHSCGDIEGHIGSDGNFYLLDFARVFPPIVKINDNGPPSHLYELIRPELVKSNHKPLSSDALTGWGKFDTNAVEHNYEVKEASYRLFLQVMPRFIKYLDSLEVCEKRELHFTQELHRVGINCRYFGLIRRELRCSSLRKLLLAEILARTMKSEIMALFRGKMKTADTPSEEPFKEVVVQYLNTIFKYENTTKGKIWPASLKASITRKFMGTFQIVPLNREVITFESIQNKKFDEEALKRYIRASELEEEEMFADDVDVQAVMKRFNQLTGVGLTKRAMKELLKKDGIIRLVQSDVKRMKAKVKAHHLVEFAEGMVLWDEAKKERKMNLDPQTPAGGLPGSEPESSDRIAERLMVLADDHFRSALSVSPHSGEVSANWALMLVERARMNRISNPMEAYFHYHAAEEKLRTSVCDGGKPKITLDNVLLEYAEFLCIWGTHSHLELDMNEANGLRGKLFSRANRKIYEAIEINPSKFTVVLQKAKFLEKGFHDSISFKEAAAYYAGASTILNCLIQSFEKLPASHYREIAEAITQNLSPYELMMKEKEVAEAPDLIHRSLDDTVGHKSSISKRKDEEEIQKILESDPFAIIRIEMGCVYIRYAYISHVYGIMCSKRNHTKMASIKLLKKSGSLFQKGIDLDPYNRDVLVDHIKKFTQSSQFVEFYQTAIGCPSILDFVEDRLLRIAHMSLKNCSHLPIEFIEGIIEYSPKVRMLVLDGCTQITDSTIELIVRKLPHLETLSLSGCVKVTTIIPNSMLKECLSERASTPSLIGHQHHSYGSLNDIIHHPEKEKKCIFDRHRSSTSNPIQSNVLMSSLNNILMASAISPQASIPLKPLTFLQNINLNKCRAVTDDKIIAIANMQLPLVNVYLKKCNITDNAIIHLTQSCPKIAALQLSGCKNLGDASINAIATNCLGLRELRMKRCPLVTSNSIDKMFRLLHNIHIVTLAESPMAVSDNTLRLMGKYCTEIQCVNVSHNSIITDVGLINLVKFTNTIQELNISQCVNITDIGIQHIAQACGKLRILRMSGLNNVTSLKPIGKSCADLVELDISECHKISSDLGYITKGCPKLTSFKLRRCYGLQDVSLLSEDGEIHAMSKLSVLDWSYGNIEFQTIHSITHSCKSLTSLNISYCKSLTDTSIERIASSLSNLKKLKMDSVVNITDDGIKALSEAPIASSIEDLSLVGCRKISDVSAQYILRFHNLKKLSLGGCLMTTAGVESIAAESFELVKISIRNCLNINPAAIKEKHPHMNIDTTQKDNAFFSE
ncbi:Histidine kinase A [Heterostelium album PN500]|uniref:Histidine kinase A n=1 Tax=Heterostelium pallidum (strain ATCC 26659 / Pp 5 / PN500) TaxID=670386 RepID=D3B1V9_HETP5|nr:Histidine kinase A [Heterostelium album PN500]EFA85283.1 Histidine kinase A [Heterostelium album PN500]|eukprot:XP_020437392.1 Histidine kinase A [Heterostelium album PN500]